MNAPLSPSTIVRLIDFAAAHPGPHTGAIELAIRRDLRLTPARYFQLLGRAIATTEALEHDPITTHRLRRRAEAKASTRLARTNLLGI